MKKKLLVLTGALAVAGTVGLGIYQSDASEAEPRLNYDEVADLISTEYPGTITEFELEKENNRAIYEIEVENDGIEYDLKVDAHSGEIVKSEKELNVSKDTTKERVDSKGKKVEQIININEAIDIALAEFSGKVEDVELEKDDGRVFYEIEMKNKGAEYEVKVDAHSGEILKSEKELNASKTIATNNVDSNEKSKQQIIDVNKAIDIALAEFSGKVEEVELDEEDGRLIYEIEIEAGDREAEFEIDAKTGKILDMEIDD